MAQTSSDLFFEKYEGESGFTSVNISQKLFEMVATVAPDDEAEFREMASGLKGIKVLVYENREGSLRSKELYAEAEAGMKLNGFDELLNVISDDENVRILSSQANPNVIDELIILVCSEEEFVLVDIFGKIDLEKLSKMAGGIDIDGMDKLMDIEIEE